MAQTRYDDYSAPDTTTRFNDKLRGILKQGVYTGFNVEPGANSGVATPNMLLGVRMDVDPDIDALITATDGATGNDGGGNPRRLTSAGGGFTAAVTAGDILRIAEPVSGTVTDNGDYLVVNVNSDTQIDVNRDWPSGGGSASLDFTVHSSIGYLRTPDGVVLKEGAGLDADIDAAFTPFITPAGARDRIDSVVMRYTYNAALPNNVGSVQVIAGTMATGLVETAVNGVTGLDDNGDMRRFTSAGMTALTTCQPGWSLIINEGAPNDGNNGTYKITAVISDTEVDVERDFPAGVITALNYIITDIALPPALTDDDVLLANVYVAAGTVAITQAMINGAEKIDLYGTGQSPVINNREGLFRAGVYTGMDLQQGTAATDVSIGKGNFLTPQNYVVSVPALLANEVTIALAAAGNHRYDWIVAVHKYDGDPADAPVYMDITGTAAVLANDIASPTDTDILTAVAAALGADYNSMDYITKLGHLYVTDATVDYHDAEKILVPDALHVVDGVKSLNQAAYVGTEGLLAAINDYYLLFRDASTEPTLIETADGVYRSRGGKILLEGEFIITDDLILPSGITLEGGGVPARIYSNSTADDIILDGIQINYDGVNDITGGIAAAIGGVGVGCPADYQRILFQVDTVNYSDPLYITNKIMAGDLVELYSPSSVNNYSVGWVEYAQQEGVAFPAMYLCVQQNAGNDYPDLLTDVDCHLCIRKRNAGLKNLHVGCEVISEFGYQHRFENVFMQEFSGKNLSDCVLDSVETSLTTSSAFTLDGQDGVADHFNIDSGSDNILGGLGGGRNVLKNIKVLSGGVTQISDEWYDHISKFTFEGDAAGDYIIFTDVNYSYIADLSVATSYMKFTGCLYNYLSDLKGDAFLAGGSNYNVVSGHFNGFFDLQAGSGCTYNKIYYSDNYLDNTGLTTNIHYYDAILAIDKNFLRKGFDDFVPAAEDNTGLVSTGATNPRGINLADGRGLFGKERILFSDIEPVPGKFDDDGLQEYQLTNKDPRIRFYGDWDTTSSIPCQIQVTDGLVSYMLITAVMTDLVFLNCKEFTSIFYDSYVDGVATGFYNPTVPTEEIGPDYGDSNNTAQQFSEAAFQNLTQNIHTIKIATRATGGNNGTFTGIEIINDDSANRNITELATSNAFSDRGLVSLAMDSNVALPTTMSLKGGKAVRYADPTGTKAWATTVIPATATTIVGVVAPLANTFNVASGAGFVTGDMVAVETTAGGEYDLYVLTNVVGAAFSISPVEPGTGYGGGEAVLLYGRTYASANIDLNSSDMVREYNYREFGCGTADDTVFADFANVPAAGAPNPVNLVGSLIDNQTIMWGDDAAGNGPHKDLNSYPLSIDALGEYIVVTFVGSGLAFKRNVISAAYIHTFTLDGVDLSVLANPMGSADDLDVIAVASDLPYGSHTLKIEKGALGVGGQPLSLLSWLVYEPAQPTFTGTSLYELNVLPDPINIVSPDPEAASIQSSTSHPVGFIRHGMEKEMYYNSTDWNKSDVATHKTKRAATITTDLRTMTFYYFGSRIIVWGTKGDCTLQVDGGADEAFNAVVGPSTVGFHTLVITRTSAINPTTIECIDVAEASHAVTPMLCGTHLGVDQPGQLLDKRNATPFLQGDLVRGSYGHSRDTGSASVNDYTATNVMHICGSGAVIWTKGKPVCVNAAGSFEPTAGVGATAVDFTYIVYIDGVGYGGGTMTRETATAKERTFSWTRVVNLPAGRHFISVAATVSVDIDQYSVASISAYEVN